MQGEESRFTLLSTECLSAMENANAVFAGVKNCRFVRRETVILSKLIQKRMLDRY